MSTWNVISLDVWGNEEDGFEVNAAYRTGQTVEINDPDSDESVLAALIEEGLIIDTATPEDIDIDGDPGVLYINDRASTMPLWELQLQNGE